MASALIVALVVVFHASSTLAQRGGPPRRLESPQTIQLPGGSRVEFHTFHSPALAKEMAYSVFLPTGYDSSSKTYPVIYFLHGMFNDHSSWCVNRYGNIPEAVEQAIVELKLPQFVMIHPDGENGYYTDSADGKALYERAIQEDLISEVETAYRIRKDRHGRAIGGTSMGGYGALKLAFKYPQAYGAVAASSPIVLTGENPFEGLQWGGSDRRAQFFARLIAQVFGDPVDLEHWKKNSPESLAGNDLKGLAVLMLYGTADRYNQMIPMEEGIRKLDSVLEAKGVPSDLRIFEGERHGWELVVQHLEEMLKFLAGSFS